MAYNVIKVDLIQTRDKIISFWKNNFSKWPVSKYDWFYTKNPYGDADCWIVQNMNEIVGTVALFPRDLSLKGKRLKSGITGDYAVSQNHRILGPALKLQRELLDQSTKKGFNLVYGYPNSNSGPVQKRVGFKVVGYTIRLVKVLKTSSYIKRKVKFGMVSDILAFPIDLVLKIFSGNIYTKINNKLETLVLKSFDQKFDELWDRIKDVNLIIGEKSSAFLNWRYSECKYHDFNCFTLRKKDSKNVVGFIVYYKNDNSARIADFAVLPKYEDDLLKAFSKYCVKKGYESSSIVFMGAASIKEMFERNKFTIRTKDKRHIMAFVNSGIDEEFVFNEDNWCLIEGDND